MYTAHSLCAIRGMVLWEYMLAKPFQIFSVLHCGTSKGAVNRSFRRHVSRLYRQGRVKHSN